MTTKFACGYKGNPDKMARLRFTRAVSCRGVILGLLVVFSSPLAFSQASITNNSISTSKTSYSAGPGSNRLIVVAVESRLGGGIDATSITWGGQVLTQAHQQTSANGNLQVEIWYLNEAGIAAATAGAVWCHDFIVTWSGAPINERFVAFTLKDVNQVSPVRDFDGANNASATTIALPAVTVAANDLVCYAAGRNANVTHTPPVGYTEITEQSSPNPTMAVAIKEISAGGTESPTASFSGGAGQVFIVGVVFAGITATGSTTYYSLASGAWNLNTTWSLSADGSTGAVPAGTWPTRADNVVIRTGHNVTIDATDDNKSCGVSPDGLGLSNVGPFAGSNLPMFYQQGDLVVSGTLTVSGIEMMSDGYTKIESGGVFSLTSSYVNLGFLEADAGSSLSSADDLILAGNSTTTINTTSISNDDLIISFTDALLCGSGTTTLQNGSGSLITFANGATINQVCTTFTINCTGVGCSGFPVVGTGPPPFGNVGPAGVGSPAMNRIWLLADKGVFSDAGTTAAANLSPVQQWNDQSGNGNNALQNTLANRPIFRTGQDNGLPALEFTGNMFIDPSALGIPGTGGFSYFVVFRDTQTGLGGLGDGSGQFILDRTTATNPLVSLKPITGNFYGFQKRTDTGAGLGGVLSSTTINTNIKWIEMERDRGVTYGLYYNGILENTIADGDGNLTPPIPRIGRHATTTNGGLRGFLQEFFTYSTTVNDAQRIIINNYISAKYGTALAVNDLYTMDDPGNGNFDFEVAGIGQATDGSSHRDARGAGVVRVWNPSDLDNNEFLLFGHDNTNLVSSNLVDVGAPIQERLSRVWRVSQTGRIGSVSLSFDISALANPLGSNLRLLIDRDGDGFADNDVPPRQGSFVGNTIVFSGVNFFNGDRFTLGNTDASVPLPVELTSFTARALAASVQLDWETASELNNDFFAIERSQDAELWEDIAIVNGAGTTAQATRYQFFDDQPLSGRTFYRLRQTDFDGQFAHSNIVSVDFKGTASVRIFPNPSTGVFTLSGRVAAEVRQFRLFNSVGQLLPLKWHDENGNTVFDISYYPQGIYIFQVFDGRSVISFRLVKQ